METPKIIFRKSLIHHNPYLETTMSTSKFIALLQHFMFSPSVLFMGIIFCREAIRMTPERLEQLKKDKEFLRTWPQRKVTLTYLSLGIVSIIASVLAWL